MAIINLTDPWDTPSSPVRERERERKRERERERERGREIKREGEIEIDKDRVRKREREFHACFLIQSVARASRKCGRALSVPYSVSQSACMIIILTRM